MQLSAKHEGSTKKALPGLEADYGWLSYNLAFRRFQKNQADSDYGWLSYTSICEKISVAL
jgi:hypothetical protein